MNIYARLVERTFRYKRAQSAQWEQRMGTEGLHLFAAGSVSLLVGFSAGFVAGVLGGVAQSTTGAVGAVTTVIAPILAVVAVWGMLNGLRLRARMIKALTAHYGFDRKAGRRLTRDAIRDPAKFDEWVHRFSTAP